METVNMERWLKAKVPGLEERDRRSLRALHGSWIDAKMGSHYPPDLDFMAVGLEEDFEPLSKEGAAAVSCAYATYVSEELPSLAMDGPFSDIILAVTCFSDAEKATVDFVMGFLFALAQTFFPRPRHGSDDDTRSVVIEMTRKVLACCPGVAVASEEERTQHADLRAALEVPVQSAGEALWAFCHPDDPGVKRQQEVYEKTNAPVLAQLRDLELRHEGVVCVQCIVDTTCLSSECPLRPSSSRRLWDVLKLSSPGSMFITGYKEGLHVTNFGPYGNAPSVVKTFVPQLTSDGWPAFTLKSQEVVCLADTVDEDRVLAMNPANSGSAMRLAYGAWNLVVGLFCDGSSGSVCQYQIVFDNGNEKDRGYLQVVVDWTTDCRELTFRYSKCARSEHDVVRDVVFVCDTSFEGVSVCPASCRDILRDLATLLEADPGSRFVAVKLGLYVVNGHGDKVWEFGVAMDNACSNMGCGNLHSYLDALVSARVGPVQVTALQFVKVELGVYKLLLEEKYADLFQRRQLECDALPEPEEACVLDASEACEAFETSEAPKP
jgi:hypothetical protein